MHRYKNFLNHFQIANATEYLFSSSEKIISKEMAAYHKNAYKLIEKINPELIKQSNITQGEPIYIEQYLYRFEGQAKDLLIEMANNHPQSSNR